MSGIVAAVRDAYPDADILCPELVYGGILGMFANVPARRIAAGMVDKIEQAIQSRRLQGGRGYERIILVGHSFGAVIARKIIILANGELPDAPFEDGLGNYSTPRSWAANITRLVMLGGMSRGWSPAHSRDWLTAAFWTLGSWWSELVALPTLGWGRPSVACIRRGAPFIVQTRLQWLALIREKARLASIGEAVTDTLIVVQMLGGSDDLVAPDDSVDFACEIQGGPAIAFALVEIPFATHSDVYRMKMPAADQLSLIEQAVKDGELREVTRHQNLRQEVRGHLFRRALTDDLKQLDDIRIDPAHMTDMAALQVDTQATDLVFVIHGIRDRGFWTQKIARVIKKMVDEDNTKANGGLQRHFRTFTGSYGYFAMVPFVLPWVRRWKVEWLMDHYVEARARQPNAKMSFVGHSNGTYLLARALKDYPAVSFERVVLAGSVVRSDYDWPPLLRPRREGAKPQIQAVLNYVATGDWVVAIFSKAFQPLRFFFDLGSAGHDGFDVMKHREVPGLHKATFIKGSHSAALVETQWDGIARFIVSGVSPAQDDDFSQRRNGALVAAGWIAPVILIVILWLVLGFGVALTKSILGDGMVQLATANVWQWEGLQCPTGSTMCQTLSPLGSAFLRLGNWLVAALQGQISAPFRAERPDTLDAGAGIRGIVCATYWWAVYVVASRF
jgi:pimeloyl-ACP methyl ester carboxylesterase